MTITPSRAFTNPFWPKNFPDPFVLKVRGHYYAYATEGETYPSQGSLVFPVLTSTDMDSWREIGKALPALGTPYQRYWAPEVIVYNGQFLLYYSVHTEEFVGGIRVAVSDRPEGPFIDSGHTLTASLASWAIDPHVFRDQDRQWYLYMTIEYLDSSQGFVGSGNAVARMRDPFTLEETITRVTPPSQKWQLFEAHRRTKGGIDWYTVEGPTVVRHRRRYYEMFSGGCFYRDNYAVSYATSDTPMGPNGLHDTSWQDWQGRAGHNFLMQGDREHFISPGHNSLVLGPNNADSYIVYHAILPQLLKERVACMDRLYWQGDDLWTSAPTFTPQPAPAMPRLRELFEAPELEPSWQPQEGRWHVDNGEAIGEIGEVVQESEQTEVALLHHRSRLITDWLLEVNLRFIAGSGSYGLVVLRNSSTQGIQLEITSDAQLVLSERVQSEGSDTRHQLRSVSLPQHVRLQAWHQLLISLSGLQTQGPTFYSGNERGLEQHTFERDAMGRLFIGLKQGQSGWILTVETANTRLAFSTLPEIFNSSDWHTLRLLCLEGTLSVALDGPDVLTLPVTGGSTKVGLVTGNASVAFTSVCQSPRSTVKSQKSR
jgi:GH43 family beta-xylosidase